jgi:hypothetical protein
VSGDGLLGEVGRVQFLRVQPQHAGVGQREVLQVGDQSFQQGRLLDQ